MKKSRKITKITAAVLAASVPVLGSATYVSADDQSKNDATSVVSSDNTDVKSENTEGEVFKDETVYAITNANGEADKIIVSDWLKNYDAISEITDLSELEGIENVKGDETFTVNSDKTMWNTDGSDIYYQGTTEKELPVEEKITYYLNDEEVSSENLVGKSGKVKIRFDYTNNSKKSVIIDGKDAEVYTPFLMLSGVSFDSSKFTNIEIVNGKIFSDGKKCMAVGFALPGMKESLNLSESNLQTVKIPEYVEITADVTDFSLAGTVTIVTNDLFNDVTIDGSTKLNDLTNPMNKLNDAVEQLLNGSNELYQGLDTLASKTGELSSGVDTLATGANKINTGAASLSDGLVQINAGITSAYDGAGKITDGLSSVKTGADSLLSGSNALSAGADQLNTGLTSAKSGLDTIAVGIDTAQASLLKTIEADTSVLAGLKTIYAKNQDASTAAMIKALEASIAGQQTIADSMKNGNGGIKDGISSVQAGIGQLSGGAAALKTGIGTLDSGVTSLKSGVDTIYGGSVSLHDGLSKLVSAGTQAQNGALSLSEGSKSLFDGLNQFQTSSGALISGITQLRDGSKKLNDGMIEFNETGIKKISEVFGGDIQNVIDRFNAISDAGEEYKNFSGIADDMDGNVKFIIKTDEIE